jgi:hypothetical protein
MMRHGNLVELAGELQREARGSCSKKKVLMLGSVPGSVPKPNACHILLLRPPVDVLVRRCGRTSTLGETAAGN